jgi:hypothetical protein
MLSEVLNITNQPDSGKSFPVREFQGNYPLSNCFFDSSKSKLSFTTG